MADGSVTIKEIRAKFTADIQDYRQKMQALSSSIAGMDGKLEEVKRKAQAAMDSPSKSTQKLGRALNAATDALQKNQQRFEDITRAGERTAKEMEKVSQKMAEMGKTYQAIMDAKASGVDLGTPIQKQMDAAVAKASELSTRIDELHQQLAAVKGTNYVAIFDGDEVVNIEDVAARIKELTKEAGAADQVVDKLRAAINNIGESNLKFANESGLEQLARQIERASGKAEQLGEKLGKTGKRAEEMAEKVQKNASEVEKQNKSLGEASQKLAKNEQALNSNAKSLSRTSVLCNALTSAGSRIGGVFSGIKSKILGIGNASRSSTGKVEGLLRSIRRISIVNLGLRLARASSGIGELQSAVTRYMDTNDAAAASIKRLRNGLANALAPAINLCVNLLSKLMPYLIGIVDAVASLITNIFGEGWVTVSTGAGAAADATKDVADNTKDAAKAQKEYNKLVAGFDEIEKLEKQSDAGGSGSSGGSGGKAKQDKADGAEGIAGKLPKWLESLIHDIDGLLEKGNFYGIGTRISETLNSATKAVDDWFNNVLRPKGVLWAGRFADVFNGLVEGYDWGLLGDTISDGLLAAIDIAGTFIRNARFESLGKGIATGINRAIKRINESDINFGSFLADLLNAGIRGLYGFASTVKWSQIGTFVANNVNKFFKTVDWEKAGRTAGRLIHGLGEMLASAIGQIKWGDIMLAFHDFFDSIKDEAPWLGRIAEAILGVWAAAKVLKTVLGGMKVAKSMLEFLQVLGGGSGGGAGSGGIAGGGGVVAGLKALSDIAATGVLIRIALVGADQAFQGLYGLYKLLFGTEEEKKEAKERAKKSGWYKIGKPLADVMNDNKDPRTDLQKEADAARAKYKQYTEGAKRRTSNQGGRVAENTQKATEKGAKASTDGWSWLKRVGVGAVSVAKKAGSTVKTVSSINNSSKSSGGSTWTATIKAKVDESFKDGAKEYGTVGDKTATATTKVGKSASYDSDKVSIYSSVGDKVVTIASKIAKTGRYDKDKKDIYSSVGSKVVTITSKIAKAAEYDKNKKNWITNVKGKNVPLSVYLKRVNPYKVKVVTRGGVTTIDTGGYSGRGGKFAKGGVVRRRTFFGLNEVGEDGKEAIIPLERNTEWTGQVAKLLARHLYDLPQPIAPSAYYSSDNAISSSDMAELVALLRAIRSDVAAVRQSGGGSVTVNTNLDGRTIARSTIDYINGQAKATGVNPLAAYM